jgi:hypothetical protein
MVLPSSPTNAILKPGQVRLVEGGSISIVRNHVAQEISNGPGCSSGAGIGERARGVKYIKVSQGL